MIRSRRAAALCLCAALGGTLAPMPAFGADPKVEAKEHYDKGIALTEAGAYDAALAEFERAYELHPSWRIFYNIGLIHQHLNDYAAALRTFQRYLAEGGAEIGGDRRKEVDGYVTTLRDLVASIAVVVDEAGAEVVLDDRPIGRSPLDAPVVVNPGHHKISATLAGRTATQLVTVVEREVASVNLEVSAPPAPPPMLVPKPKPKDFPWLAWGATAALTGGAIVAGSFALRASTTLADDKRTDGISRSTLDAQASKTKTLALVTDVLVGSAIVMAGVSVYLTVAPRGKSGDEGVSAKIQLGVGLGSVQVIGSF
jgi:hypothetical protein